MGRENPGPAVVESDGGHFYAPSMFDTNDWRVYEINYHNAKERWVICFTGKDAEAKAKAVSMILNAESTW